MVRKFTAQIEVPSDPAAPLQVVTKQYADAIAAAKESIANKGVAGGYASLDAGGRLPNTQSPIVPTPVRTGSVSSALTSDASSGAGNLLDIAVTGDATINAPTSPANFQTFEWHLLASGAARNITFGGGFVAGGLSLGPYAVPQGAVLIARAQYVGNRTTSGGVAAPAWVLVSASLSDSTGGSGGAPDATTTSKGVVQLAGDLGGTAAAPTVPALANLAPLASPTFTGTVNMPVTQHSAATANNSVDKWFITGDTQSRLSIFPDGYMAWGPGVGASDVDFYRNAAGVLRTAGQILADKGVLLPAPPTKTANYTLADTDEVVIFNPSSGALTGTLPTAVGRAGKRFTIKKLAGTTPNSVIIATTSSQTIDGATTETISVAGGFRELISDGANWHIIGGKVEPVVISLANVGAAGTINVDASIGSVYRVTVASGACSLAVPTNPIDADQINLEILATAAATITPNASITNCTGVASPFSIAAGKVLYLGLRYRASVWKLLAYAIEP